MNESLSFYATPGTFTSLGDHSKLLDSLPRNISALCGIIQGVMLHIFWADRYGVQLDAMRREEVQVQAVSRQLGRITALDPRPLDMPREPERRLVGNCRDFSVMLTHDDLATLDQVAALTRGDAHKYARVRQLCLSDERLRVPATIHSYVEGGMRTEDLEHLQP